LTFPEINERLLKLSVQSIARIRRGGNHFVVLGARTGVVAHQGPRIGNTDVRAVEVRRDFQSGGIVFDRARIVTGIAQHFAE